MRTRTKHGFSLWRYLWRCFRLGWSAPVPRVAVEDFCDYDGAPLLDCGCCSLDGCHCEVIP